MAEKVEIIAELKDLVSGKMAEINASVSKLEESLQKAGGAGGGVKGGIMGSVLGANLLTGAFSQAGNAALSFEKDAIKSFSNFEQFQVALTTMFHGNKEEAKGLSAQLQKFAQETPFELTEIQAATKQMIAFGSTSGGVVEEMRRLGDVSSGIGAPLGDMAYLYGTIRTSGRAMTMDINQFANRGIPIWKELEKITGKSGMALRKMVEEGKIGFPQIEQVFKNMTSAGGQFAGMMSEQSKTLGGQISNLGDAWDQLKVNVGNAQSGILKSTVAFFSSFLSEINKTSQQANRIQEAITQRGGRSYNVGAYSAHEGDFAARFGNELTKLDKNQQEQFAMAQKSFESAKTDPEKKAQINLIEKLISSLEKDKLKYSIEMQYLQKYGKEDKATYANQFLSQLGLTEAYQRQLKQLIKKPTGDDGKGSGSLDPAAAAKLDVLAKANRPTQYYITIKEQIHEVNISPASMKEGVQEITSMLSKGLMMAVNDISVLDNQR